MSITTFDDLTQSAFDTAEQLVIAKVRTAYPQLDLRAGTVLREQLIRPGADLHALDQSRMDTIEANNSLQVLSAQPAPDTAAVNAILSNFNMTLQGGTRATGILIVNVDANRIYSLPAGLTFSTLDGTTFTTLSAYTVRMGAANNEIELNTNDIAYFFLLPVTASVAGVAGNLVAGTAVDATSGFYGYVASSAYTDFSGGTDVADLPATIARIPSALSQRSFTDDTAITARLTDYMTSAGYTLQAVSVQGYGDPAQLRDKHNLMGFAVGSRVDVWLRSYGTPAIEALTLTGTWTGANTYAIQITPTTSPGGLVRSVSELDAVAAGSYGFTFSPNVAVPPIRHDLLGTLDTIGTVYRNGTLIVTGVPYSEPTRGFKVEFYSAPGLVSAQSFADNRSVKCSAGDTLIRTAMVCRVSCSGTVYHKSGVVVDMSGLRSKLAAYINSRSFVPRLTRSELASILLDAGVSRIDLSDRGFQLAGILVDGTGVSTVLSGDSLEIPMSPRTLVTPDTTVFVTDVTAINLTLVTE